MRKMPTSPVTLRFEELSPLRGKPQNRDFEESDMLVATHIAAKWAEEGDAE